MPDEGENQTAQGRHNFTSIAILRAIALWMTAFRHSEWSEFAYGRSKTSPDSEQIEYTVAMQHVRNSVSVEQIQDSEESQSRCNVKEILRLRLQNGCIMLGDVSRESRKVAFTLAEVLITLGIIGVVAALTLPSVIHKYKTEVLKNQFKKSYSTLSQAVLMAREEVGVPNFSSYCTTWSGKEFINSDECIKAIKKNLKATGLRCNYDKNKIYTYSKTQSGAYVDMGATAYPYTALPDGSCVDVIINSSILGVSVDINGYKRGPNALGHDIFSFWVNKNDALVPIKSNGYQDDEQLQAKIEACGTDRINSCTAYAHQLGYPCTIKSNQKGNGLGCSWFAINDVSPDDPTKGYWESLPR